jgi:hypothetical protein
MDRQLERLMTQSGPGRETSQPRYSNAGQEGTPDEHLFPKLFVLLVPLAPGSRKNPFGIKEQNIINTQQ